MLRTRGTSTWLGRSSSVRRHTTTPPADQRPEHIRSLGAARPSGGRAAPLRPAYFARGPPALITVRSPGLAWGRAGSPKDQPSRAEGGAQRPSPRFDRARPDRTPNASACPVPLLLDGRPDRRSDARLWAEEGGPSARSTGRPGPVVAPGYSAPDRLAGRPSIRAGRAPQSSPTGSARSAMARGRLGSRRGSRTMSCRARSALLRPSGSARPARACASSPTPSARRSTRRAATPARMRAPSARARSSRRGAVSAVQPPRSRRARVYPWGGARGDAPMGGRDGRAAALRGVAVGEAGRCGEVDGGASALSSVGMVARPFGSWEAAQRAAGFYAAVPALDEGRGHRSAAARCAAPWPPAVLRRVAGGRPI